MDVYSRYVPARAPGLHGGRDERSGSVPGVRPAPGHGAQNAGLLGSARLPTKGCAPKPKLELFTVVIDAILDGDGKVPRKQRHTAKLIFERLRDEYGFEGQYTIAKDCVREQGRQTKEMFVPLSHAPGHAQCDFGEALAVIGGVECKAHYFVLDLPHSDGCFVKAYPAETTEAFLDGYVAAFAFWAECPRASCTTIPGWRWPGSWATVAQVHPCVHRAAVPLPVRRPVRSSRRGQRQKQGGRHGGLRAAQLPGANTILREFRSAECSPGREVSGADARSPARTRRDHRPTHGAGPGCADAPARRTLRRLR